MIARPRVAVLTGFGINCDLETTHAFEQVGGDARRIHVNELAAGRVALDRFHILAVPGGFSFGDHLGSGRLLGNRLRFALRDPLLEFVQDGKPVIGICNGFQVLVKTGLLPGQEPPLLEQTATITLNDSGRFEDRWVHMAVRHDSRCIWTQGIDRLEAPIRHGEGKFFVPGTWTLDALEARGQLVLRYAMPPGQEAEGEGVPYPWNPNGSLRDVAGVCDPSGLVMGLMPHPEAYHSRYLHPTWTRTLPPAAGATKRPFQHLVANDVEASGEEDADSQDLFTGTRHRRAEREAWQGAGLKVFRNAIHFVQQSGELLDHAEPA